MKEIVIIGTGGHAKVVYDILLKQNLYKPVAFISLNEQLTSFLGMPHLHQSKLSETEFNAGVVAVGDNTVRSEAVEFILSVKPKFKFVTAVHPSAAIAADVVIGDGSVVMAQVAINSGSKIGTHAIINTGSSVDHDCQIGEYASIAPGCVLGGDVRVGDYSAISIGATVLHGRSVGNHTVVGAGSLVLKDLESYKVAYGNPCQVIRARFKGEKYL